MTRTFASPAPSLVYVGERESDEVWMLDYQGEHRFVVRAGRSGRLTVSALTQAEKNPGGYEPNQVVIDEVADVTPEQWEAAAHMHDAQTQAADYRGECPAGHVFTGTLYGPALPDEFRRSCPLTGDPRAPHSAGTTGMVYVKLPGHELVVEKWHDEGVRVSCRRCPAEITSRGGFTVSVLSYLELEHQRRVQFPDTSTTQGAGA